MIAESKFSRPIFWIVMGLLYALIIAGAPIWAQDLGLHMTWWKWCLATSWYVLLSFSLASGFTLLGEKESGAWYKVLGLYLIITLILGVGLWVLL